MEHRKSLTCWYDRALNVESIDANACVASEADSNSLSTNLMNPIPRIAPALMHIENLSLASLNQVKRGVGVTDLREALSGRNSMSNAALSGRAPSVMTGDRASSIIPELALRPVKSRTDKKRLVSGSSEVRDVLSKLGIGSRPSTNGNSLLRAPSATSQSKQSSWVTSLPHQRSLSLNYFAETKQLSHHTAHNLRSAHLIFNLDYRLPLLILLLASSSLSFHHAISPWAFGCVDAPLCIFISCHYVQDSIYLAYTQSLQQCLIAGRLGRGSANWVCNLVRMLCDEFGNLLAEAKQTERSR